MNVTQKEDDEKKEPRRQQYAHTELQNNYQYQQRHQFNQNQNNNHLRNNRNNNFYARSEQQHYRGANRRREIAADPYSLQRVSSKLPKRPRQAYQPRHNDHGNKLFPIKITTNSTPIKFRCETLIKYDIEFEPPIAEDAKQIRRRAINHCHADIHEIYGTFYDDNTRVYAERDIKETKEFVYDQGRKIILKYGQKLKIQELDLQYKKQIQGIILQSLIRKADLRRFGRGHYDMAKQARLPIRGPSDKFPKNLSLLPFSFCIPFRNNDDICDELYVEDIERVWKRQ